MRMILIQNYEPSCTFMSLLRTFLAALLLTVSSLGFASADELAAQTKAKQIWQLLDYLAVDYGKAVKDGSVTSASEYAEMQEFASAAERQLKEMVPRAPTELLTKASSLRSAIDRKAPAGQVSTQAHALATALIAVYPVPMAPARVPDLKHGAALYQANCTACHGVSGRSDGPLSATLSPPPIVLAEHARARERSVFALQQIITHGVQGTSMPSFAHLSDDDRWALAYFASSLSYSEGDRQAGAALWASRPSLHTTISNLGKLSQLSEASLATSVGPDVAKPLLAYLRSNPAAVGATTTDTLPIAKSKLKESLLAFDKGDMLTASRLALSAYLDGFEPVEPALAAKNQGLFNDIEKSMGSYRNAITSGNAGEARAIEQRLQGMLTAAQSALEGNSDPLSTFIGALTILLREGVEALLVVVAMLAFLKKAGRHDVIPYIHTGWVVALAAGAATWAAATYLVDVSGASREMTEGFSAIFAAVILLAVGIWMHQKSLAGRWQAYVRDKLSSALTKRSALMLFVLSFVTVYREVFETVLFYAALWNGGNGAYMLGGLGCGIAILGVIAAVLLRSATRLPISQFFAFSSALVAVLATVLVGKGVAALQKVGMFANTPVRAPQIDILGVYPSLQTLLAQLLIVVIVVLSVSYNVRPSKVAR
jgi:high-affinity iron transporter